MRRYTQARRTKQWCVLVASDETGLDLDIKFYGTKRQCEDFAAKQTMKTIVEPVDQGDR